MKKIPKVRFDKETFILYLWDGEKWVWDWETSIQIMDAIEETYLTLTPGVP